MTEPKRYRTCSISGLPLATLNEELKTRDGHALDLDAVAGRFPEFGELRRIADMIAEPVLLGFGDHRLSVNRAMSVDRRAGEGRALPRADNLRVNSAYHLVQAPVGETIAGKPIYLYATLPSSAWAGNGNWRAVRSDEKNTSGLMRGR